MTTRHDQPADAGRATVYEVRINGRLDARWSEWFEGLEVTSDGGDTLLTGCVIDQAALHGLLRRVRDFGLPLVSVTPLESDPRKDPNR
jgi:hypothetical protein